MSNLLNIIKIDNTIIAYPKRLNANNPPEIILDDIKTAFNNKKQVTNFFGRETAQIFESYFYNKKIIIREYWRGGILRKLLKNSYLNFQRFLDELEITEHLYNTQINELSPAFVIIQKKNIFYYSAYLATYKIENAINFFELIKSKQLANNETLKKFIFEVLKKINLLADAGIFHKDLQIKNILVSLVDIQEAPKLFFIDFDRAKKTGQKKNQKKTEVSANLHNNAVSAAIPASKQIYYFAMCFRFIRSLKKNYQIFLENSYSLDFAELLTFLEKQSRLPKFQFFIIKFWYLFFVI